MIARHETNVDKTDIWAQLSAPLPTGVISWRQDGRPVARDGKYVARFVAYVDANTVRERLDSVVPGVTYLRVENGGDVTFYAILKLDRKHLDLRYADRGGSLLRFIRVVKH